MMRSQFLLMQVAMVFIASVCQAAEVPQALNAFRDFTYMKGRCDHQASMGLLENERIRLTKRGTAQTRWDKLSDCIQQAMLASKPTYIEASQALEDKPKARELLKDYYAAWLQAMSQIVPGQAEVVERAYYARLTRNFEPAESTWVRLQVALLAP